MVNSFFLLFSARPFTPIFGHKSAITHFSQRGLRDKHTLRPCMMSRPLKCSHSSCGTISASRQFYLRGVLVAGQTEPTREPADVGVNGNARRVEAVTENHVRGLAANTRQRDEVFECGRNVPAEAVHHFDAAARMFFALFL